MPKVFVIGPNKCATGSLHQFFKNNGLKSVHWDDGLLAKRMVSNVSAGLNVINGYEDYDCFLDFYLLTPDLFISPLLLRPYIASQFPDALYILNSREKSEWKKSRLKHDNGSFQHRLTSCLGDEYSSENEYESYFDISDIDVKFLHFFDLEAPDKFQKLGAFLNRNGIHVSEKKEVKSNISANLYK